MRLPSKIREVVALAEIEDRNTAVSSAMSSEISRIKQLLEMARRSQPTLWMQSRGEGWGVLHGMPVKSSPNIAVIWRVNQIGPLRGSLSWFGVCRTWIYWENWRSGQSESLGEFVHKGQTLADGFRYANTENCDSGKYGISLVVLAFGASFLIFGSGLIVKEHRRDCSGFFHIVCLTTPRKRSL
jgi:hypothetical protein